MAQIQTQSNFYTPEDYLDLEAQATEKSEYYNGEIFKMAGGSLNHNQISLNISSALNFDLKRKDYRVCIADVKLWIPQKNSFNYPDVMIIPKPPTFYKNRKDVVLNPVAIIEVLSDSTKDYDRSDKFRQYRSLPSLQDYILVDQDKAYIEYFKKTAAHEWLFIEIDHIDKSLNLASINTSLKLIDIYDNVDFD